MDDQKFACSFAFCVTSGAGFEKGKIYPILGDNNGIHIMRENSHGRENDPGGDSSDPYDFVACSGGIGEGEFNNCDDSGCPSFNMWKVTEYSAKAIRLPNANPYYKRFICAGCGQMLWGFNYCPECGRRIKYE